MTLISLLSTLQYPSLGYSNDSPGLEVIQYCRYQELYPFPEGNFRFNTKMVSLEPAKFMTRYWLPITNQWESVVFTVIPFNYQLNAAIQGVEKTAA